MQERALSNWPAQVPKPQIPEPTLILQLRALSVVRNPSQPCATIQPRRSLPVEGPAPEPLDQLPCCCVLARALPDKFLSPIKAFYNCVLSNS